MIFAVSNHSIEQIKIQTTKLLRRAAFDSKKHTGQIAGKRRPLIPISMNGIERIEDIEKKPFLYKNNF